MIVMLGGNSNGYWHYLAGKYPGRIGMLTAPSYFAPVHTSPWLQFALDNGKFPVWSKGIEWDESEFWEMCDAVKRLNRQPRFVVVPDVVADMEATIESWWKFSPRLQKYGWPLAFACQDGMTVGDIPMEASVAFIGGTTRWKWRNAERFCKEFPRVHIARVEIGNLTKVSQCDKWGAESIDSTGAFRDGTDAWRLKKIELYLSDRMEKELFTL